MSQSNTSNSENKKPTRLKLKDNPVGQGLILCAMAMIGLGVIMVASAMSSPKTSNVEWWQRVDGKQIIFAAAAICILVFFWMFNYSWLAKGKKLPWLTLILFTFALLCAFAVFIPGVGHSVGGKFRWIRIGNFNFQPSEVLKLVAVCTVCVYLTRPGVNIKKFSTFFIATLLIGVCVAAVVKDDFGTGVIIATSAAIAMFLAGVPWYYFATGVPLAIYGGYKLMLSAPYRVARWQAMMDPWDTANKASYHPRQSILAILSGEWTGSGLGSGVRKMGFLPEDSTDFIFAIICEETGLAGAVLLLALLAGLLWLSFSAARSSKDPLGRVLAGSLGAMIVLQASMHIAVNLNLLPPTGIALPFISAGGTGVMIMCVAVSIIVSISARPKDNEPELNDGK